MLDKKGEANGLLVGGQWPSILGWKAGDRPVDSVLNFKPVSPYLDLERVEYLRTNRQIFLFALVTVCLFFVIVCFNSYSLSYGDLPIKEVNIIDSENVTVTRAHFEQMLSMNRPPAIPRFDYLNRFSGTKVTLTPTDLLAFVLCFDGTFNQELFEDYKNSPYIRIEYIEQKRLFSIEGINIT